MYQVIFSDESLDFFKQLPMDRQLSILSAISKLSPVVLEEAREPLGKFKYQETLYYRFKFEDLRFYFTLKSDLVNCCRILTKNTWADFRVRNNLEKFSDNEVEQRASFGSFLEGK